MASKIINGSTANENISSRMVCSSKAYTDGNYSLVSVSGRLSRKNTGYTTSGTGTFYLEIDGKKYENTGYYEITYNSDTAVITVKNIKVSHSADGSKKITVKFYGSMPDTTLTSISCSGTFTLDNIPRESEVSVNVTQAKAGDTITVSLDRAVNTYTHDITFKLGNRSETVTGVGESTKWTIPKSWQDQFPSASSSTLTITAVTKSGSTSIGTTSTTVKVLPSVDAAPSLTAAVEGINLYWDLYIRTKSKAKITLTAGGKYGASISKYKISGGGFSGTTNPYTTGYLLQDGDITFTCTATDSRGLTTTVPIKINVQAYDPPSILRPEVHRTDESGTETINGAYIYAKATRGYSSCDGNNTASMVVQYKESGGTYGSRVALEDGTVAILGDGLIESNKFYVAKITVSDYFGTVSQEFQIYTDEYRAAFGKDAAAILRYPPDGGAGFYTTDIHAYSEEIDGPQKVVGVSQLKGYKYVHYYGPSQGSAGYGKIATIYVDSTWQDTGFGLELIRRGEPMPYHLWFRFTNSPSEDPTLANFYCLEQSNYTAYMVKRAAKTWDLYVYLYAYNCVCVTDFIHRPGTGITVTWSNSFSTSLPSGAVQASSRIYEFDNTVQVRASICADNHVYIGEDGDLSSAKGIKVGYADGSKHDIVCRDANGLTSYFGWGGSSSYASLSIIRGQTVQAKNASGVTALSDERMKTDFADLDKWDNFFSLIEPMAFKMVNGNSGRFHVGFKAQQIEQALVDSGLTTQDFAGFIRQPYRPDPDDPEGNAAYELAGIRPGDDEYGLIYTEFVALNTYKIQKQQEKIDTLEREVLQLKQIVQSLV